MGSGTGLSEAIIASLILAMSVIAVGFAALRKPPENRTPFWFGMFGCLYGVRLAAQSELVQPFFPEVYWRSLDAFINYAIIVPAGLFADSVFGPGLAKHAASSVAGECGVCRAGDSERRDASRAWSGIVAGSARGADCRVHRLRSRAGVLVAGKLGSRVPRRGSWRTDLSGRRGLRDAL